MNLRSCLVSLGLAFHVVPGGDVPTKSGRSQAERGESKKTRSSRGHSKK
jgi:hypothetical protein